MCAVLRTPYMIYGELRVCTASSGSDQYTVCILLTVYQKTVSLHPALCTPGWSIHSVLLRASIKPSCPLYPTVSTSVADPYPTRRCPPKSAVRYGNERNLQRLDFPFRLFLAVFFPFSFCRSSPPLRFFFFFSLLFPLSLPLFSLFPFNPAVRLRLVRHFSSLLAASWFSCVPDCCLCDFPLPPVLHCCTHCSSHHPSLLLGFCTSTRRGARPTAPPPSLAVDTQDSYALVHSNVRLTFSLPSRIKKESKQTFSARKTRFGKLLLLRSSLRLFFSPSSWCPSREQSPLPQPYPPITLLPPPLPTSSVCFS